MVCGEYEQRISEAIEDFPMGISCCQVGKDQIEQEEYLFYRANAAFYDCIGYTAEEFMEKGNSFLRIVVRDERRLVQERMHLATEHKGIAYSNVIGILQKGQKICKIQWSVRCVENNGAFFLLQCCSRLDEMMRSQAQLMDRLNREKQEKKRLNDLIYELPVGVAVIRGGRNLMVEVANSGFMKGQGYTVVEITENRVPFPDYIYHRDIGHFEEMLENCLERKSVEKIELRMVAKNGDLRWEYLQCQLYYYKDAVPHYILTTWDINDRKELEDELRLMDEQYRMLEEVSDEFPLEYDVVTERFRIPQKYYQNGKVTDRNRKYMNASDMLEDIHIGDQDKFARALYIASEHEMTGSIDYRLNMSPAGGEAEYVWHRLVFRSMRDRNEQISRIIGRSYDISYDKGIQEKLSKEVQHDPLTGLLNKVAVGNEIKKCLADKPKGIHVLFLVDIDNFKRINDTFGHTVGDTVITDVAQAIEKLFRQSDIVGRIGGDEFVAFMRDTTEEGAMHKAEQLCREAAKKLTGDEKEVEVTLSVGLAIYGINGTDYETLLDMADRAMYQTKRAGKNNYSMAQNGKMIRSGSTHREKTVESEHLRTQEADKEFLNFAFSLLSHAKDVNGSLNVLLEQIGKKYGLSVVSVFEYADQKPEMLLTNFWSSFGTDYRQDVLPRSIKEFIEATSGAFVVTTSESMKKQNRAFWENWNCGMNQISHIAGVKFDIPGNHQGCLYVGISQKEEGFNDTEKNTLCELARIVAVFVSLRNKIRDAQTEIQQLQSRDKLTGLYNFEVFKKRTGELLCSNHKGEQLYALVHVDINNFSYVNENFGQKVGDDILKEFGTLLASGEHVVEACRMYSDYFIELVVGKSEEDIYHRVLDTNNCFERMQKQKYPTSSMHLSMGICFVENEREPFEKVLEGANLARKQAKEQKSTHAVIYKKDMRERRDDEIHITGRFYAAMQKGELELFLQPKFLLKEQKVYGAEALARWRLPNNDLLSPDKFIPPLENLGYIVDLDFFILEQLLRAMKRWRDAGKELFTISTNFSRRNFEQGGKSFIQRLQQTMERYKIEPHYIEIEVTESVIVENLSELKGCLERLKELGYRIAIDDFGTGYSSLSVLLEIPANIVKIDKKFTDRVDMIEQREFVSQMGKFIRSAKEEVIFEGIEKQEQRQFLLDCGFRYGQGFLFDRPLPVEEFERKYL